MPTVIQAAILDKELNDAIGRALTSFLQAGDPKRPPAAVTEDELSTAINTMGMHLAQMTCNYGVSPFDLIAAIARCCSMVYEEDDDDAPTPTTQEKPS